MGKISVLDCTLRDGGYINDWNFGEKAIKDISRKVVRTGIEYFEVGFIKDVVYDPNRSIFSGNGDFSHIIEKKEESVIYFGMADMNSPMPLDKLGKRVPGGFDGIRVIFKKNKIDEGYEYCKKALELGYVATAQLVGTYEYSDVELVETVRKFNKLDILGLSIVDTFGLIEKKDFLRMVSLIDHNLREDIALCYHSHNNLQQAMGNASALVEQNLKRDIIIDACIFGMGRGAGNLNMELFVQYLNENYNKNYRVEPFLEIIDEYLNDIYRKEFWGYSLPYYLSAVNGCHPNYAKFFAEKGTLTVKAFKEILRTIPAGTKEIYSRESAEKIYIDFMENFEDDKECIDTLRTKFQGRDVLIIGSGSSVKNERQKIQDYIDKNNPITVSLNYVPDDIKVDYVFSCHMRRFRNIQDKEGVTKIITSNIRDAQKYDYKVNFSSYAADKIEIMDNSGVMFVKLLIDLGIPKVTLAGMDGYSLDNVNNYINSGLEYGFSKEMLELRNKLIKENLCELSGNISIDFLTNSIYKQEEG